MLHLQALGVYGLFKEHDVSRVTSQQIVQKAKENHQKINRKLIPLNQKDSLNKNFLPNLARLLTSLIRDSPPFLQTQVVQMTKLFSEVSACPIKELRLASLEVLNILLMAIVQHRMQSE